LHDSHISLVAGPIFFPIVWSLRTGLLERVIKEDATNVAYCQFPQKGWNLGPNLSDSISKPIQPGLIPDGLVRGKDWKLGKLMGFLPFLRISEWN